MWQERGEHTKIEKKEEIDEPNIPSSFFPQTWKSYYPGEEKRNFSPREEKSEVYYTGFSMWKRGTWKTIPEI